jgi:hypothetical protein
MDEFRTARLTLSLPGLVVIMVVEPLKREEGKALVLVVQQEGWRVTTCPIRHCLP